MRILVVEDEHRIAQAIKKGLEQEKFAVDVAFTGTQALDLAFSEEYDLIILDIMLPEVDGVTVCKNLRAKNNHTPVLMLTARDQVDDIVNGLNSGADDYLKKPFSFEELLARVRALLRRPAQVVETIVKFDGIEIDPQQFTVTRDGQEIILSSKEFALLHFFMRHPNQILSKDKLIGHVWDYNADILPNTLEVTIRNLRKKVELPFPHLPQLIHTVRGYGYKLVISKSLPTGRQANF